MKKRLLLITTLIIFSMIIAACGQAGGANDAPVADDTSVADDSGVADDTNVADDSNVADDTGVADSGATLQFVLVSPLVGHPYWVEVEDGMLYGDSQFGVETQYVGPSELNINEQINMIETAIVQQVDGIITMALDPEAFVPVIDRAVDAGIPVVLIDSDAPDSNRNFYAGTSNYAAGYEAGRAMIEATGGNANIGIITGAIAAPNLNERIDGFRSAIADYPDMVILAVEAAYADLLRGTESAQTLLLTYPEMDAFFGASATDALAAGMVVSEQGRADEFTIVGFDDLDDTLTYIRDGIIHATIVQRPFEMGRLGVELLYRIHQGEAPNEDVIDTGVIVVTIDNVDSY